MKALDVGSGSGYLTACFALMVSLGRVDKESEVVMTFRIPTQVGEKGLAVGIDHVDELVKWSKDNVRKSHGELLDSGRIKFVGEFAFSHIC